MFKRLKKLTMPKRILLSAVKICVFIAAGVLIYSNSRYSDKYLIKVRDEIIEIFDETKCCGVIAVNYQERVVKVKLDARNTFNEELTEYLEKEYGKAVSVSDGYYHELLSE